MTTPTTTENKYITQHCANGSCEGTKKISALGASFVACRGQYSYRGRMITCTHDCHEMFRQLREITGITDSVGPVVIEQTSILGRLSVTGFLHPTVTTTAAIPIERDGHADPTGANEPFSPTPSGQRARGQLEEQVRTEVQRFFNAGVEMIATLGLTPTLLAKAINQNKPPSQGAVYAVLKRWERDGLVTLAEKPFRLVGITDLGKRRLMD